VAEHSEVRRRSPERLRRHSHYPEFRSREALWEETPQLARYSRHPLPKGESCNQSSLTALSLGERVPRSRRSHQSVSWRSRVRGYCRRIQTPVPFSRLSRQAIQIQRVGLAAL